MLLESKNIEKERIENMSTIISIISVIIVVYSSLITFLIKNIFNIHKYLKEHPTISGDIEEKVCSEKHEMFKKSKKWLKRFTLNLIRYHSRFQDEIRYAENKFKRCDFLVKKEIIEKAEKLLKNRLKKRGE